MGRIGPMIRKGDSGPAEKVWPPLATYLIPSESIKYESHFTGFENGRAGHIARLQANLKAEVLRECRSVGCPSSTASMEAVYARFSTTIE